MKRVVGFEKWYSVTEDGRIFSHHRDVGLTEFDIDQIPYSCSHADSRLIAYAIEAKLKEKNNV